MLDTILKLSELLCGISSDEAYTNAIADYLGGQCEMDAEGNLYLNKQDHAPVLLVVPFYSYPIEVDTVREDGAILLKLHDALSIAPLPGSEVCVHGRKTYTGIIGSVPPHLQKGYQATAPYELNDLHCDVGGTYEELRNTVLPGSRIDYHVCEAFRLAEGKIAGRNLDFAAPAAAVLLCAAELKKEFTVCFCTNRFEALRQTDPECVIVVDAVDIEQFRREHVHGKGLHTLCIENGICVNPRLREILKSAADRARVENSMLIRSDKSEDPHALNWYIKTMRGGTPVANILLPFEGGSSGVQIMAEDAAELLSRMLKEINEFPKRSELCSNI